MAPDALAMLTTALMTGINEVVSAAKVLTSLNTVAEINGGEAEYSAVFTVLMMLIASCTLSVLLTLVVDLLATCSTISHTTATTSKVVLNTLPFCAATTLAMRELAWETSAASAATVGANVFDSGVAI